MCLLVRSWFFVSCVFNDSYISWFLDSLFLWIFSLLDIKAHSWFFCPVSAFGSNCTTTRSYMSTARQMEIKTKLLQFCNNSILILICKQTFIVVALKNRQILSSNHLQRKQEELQTDGCTSFSLFWVSYPNFLHFPVISATRRSHEAVTQESDWRGNLFYIDIHIIRGCSVPALCQINHDETHET